MQRDIPLEEIKSMQPVCDIPLEEIMGTVFAYGHFYTAVQRNRGRSQLFLLMQTGPGRFLSLYNSYSNRENSNI